jgi:hypothetical protein
MLAILLAVSEQLSIGRVQPIARQSHTSPRGPARDLVFAARAGDCFEYTHRLCDVGSSTMRHHNSLILVALYNHLRTPSSLSRVCSRKWRRPPCVEVLELEAGANERT